MVGSRFKAHLEDLTQRTAGVFDAFVLSCRPEVVSQSADWAGDDPAQAMLAHGHRCLRDLGVPESAIYTTPDPQVALQQALAQARAGDPPHGANGLESRSYAWRGGPFAGVFFR